MDITLIYGYGYEAVNINDYTNEHQMRLVAEKYGLNYDAVQFEKSCSEGTLSLDEFLGAMKEQGIFESKKLPLSFDEMDGTYYIYFKACMPWDMVPNMPTSYEEANRQLDEFLQLLFGETFIGNYDEVANATYC